MGARELLQLVGGVGDLVDQDVVVRGARGALEAGVAVEEKVELHGVHNRPVHHRTWHSAEMHFLSEYKLLVLAGAICAVTLCTGLATAVCVFHNKVMC